MYGDVCYQVTNFSFNTLRPRQNGRHFADDIFKCIFLNENAWILIKISLKFVHKGSINNIPALFQIMAWRRPGDKPLSEPMLVRIPTHICVTRPQWVNDCENICTARNYHHQVGNMNHQPLFRVREFNNSICAACLTVFITTNIKAPRHWTLWGEFTGEFAHKGPITRKMFPFDYVFIS